MGKRPPILVDRRRSWLLALVVAASFAVHLGVIGYFGWQETDAPSTGPTFIEVALVGGGAAPKPAVPEVPEAPRTLDARKSKPPVEVAPRKKTRGKPDVILPGKPTPSPSPKPTPKPTLKPTPKPTSKPKPKPTAKPRPAQTVAPRRSPKPTAAPIRGEKEPSRAGSDEQAVPGRDRESAGSRTKPRIAESKPSAARPSEAVSAEEARRAARMSRSLEKARDRAGAATAGGGNGVSGGTGSGSGGSGLGGSGGSGGSGPARPPEFVAYYSLMLERIRDAWVWAGRRPDLSVTVGFAVSDQGGLSRIRVVEASSDPSYDASVLRALRAVRVLPPPPLAFRRDFRDVELVFRPSDLGRGP